MDPPNPLPTRVEPTSVYNGRDETVVVEGQDFYPRLRMSVVQSDRSEVDATYEVALRNDVGERFAARSTVLQNISTLEATVPAGTPVGVYDLVVTSPNGGEGILEDALTVTDVLATRVEVTVDAVSTQVNDMKQVTLAAVDGLGKAAPVDLEVVVDLRIPEELSAGEDRSSSVEWTLPSVDDEAWRITSEGLNGRLGADGTTTFGVTTSLPGTYDIEVTVVDSLGVSGDTTRVEWRPGDELLLDISLPDGFDGATAGETFSATLRLRDQFGTALDDLQRKVVLANLCGGWVDSVFVSGPTQIPVTLIEATSDGTCIADALRSVSAEIPGQSATFAVDAAEMSAFSLQVVEGSVVAGDSLTAIVESVDPYGNQAAWVGSSVIFSDSVDGVETSDDCDPSSSPSVCSVRVTRAGTEITLEINDDLGRTGRSNTYDVEPGPLARPVIGVLPDTLVAGVAFVLEVAFEDAYGNAVAATSVLDEDVTLTSGLGEAPACVPQGVVGQTRTWSCVLTEARSGQTIRADVLNGVSSGFSDPFRVVNGELAAVSVTPATTSVLAGEAFALTLDAVDAWGNPYETQSSAVLELADTTSTLDTENVTLTADGSAVVDVTLTQAGLTSITAAQFGADLGSSLPITVGAAEAIELSAAIDAPWVWVGETTAVSVEALDAWGNRSTISTSIEVTSSTQSGVAVTGAMVNGVGEVAFTWNDANINDSLLVSTVEGLTAELSDLRVAKECPSAGPTADVSFNGEALGRACVDETTGLGTLSATLVGSSAGAGGQLFAYGIRIIGGSGETGTTPTFTVDTPGEGVSIAEAIVIQADGCGDDVTARVYSALDDGTPVGPLVIDVLDPVIDIDGGAQSAVVVDGALDCKGNPADGGTLFVRTDKGTIVGATPTGSGLALTLNSSGDAVAQLDAAMVEEGGEAALAFSHPSNAVSGTAVVELVGDVASPTLWDQAPRSPVLNPISEIVLTFSEPIEPMTVEPSKFLLSGAGTSSVVGATVDDSGRLVTLDVSPPADPQLGAWSLTVDQSVSDLNGNHLSGDWSGAPTELQIVFQSIAGNVQPIDTCALATVDEQFRPDGDDGVGIDADTIEVAYSSAQAPAWWVLTVLDASGELVRVDYEVPSQANGQWTWDGRDQTGTVLPAGAYVVMVQAEGASGARGTPCFAPVLIDLPVTLDEL